MDESVLIIEMPKLSDEGAAEVHNRSSGINECL